MNNTPESSSPKWSATTKTVVGLAIFLLFVAALFYFRQLVAPLLLAFILAYLFHPLAARLSNSTRLSWRASVNLIYLLLVTSLAAILTLAGLAIVQQVQSLIIFLQRFTSDLPNLVSELSAQVYRLGPFKMDLSQYDFTSLTEQILGIIQPLLGRAGTVVSKVATSAASTLGWGMFILLVSYFLLSEAGHLRENILRIEIPGYGQDIQRLGRELSKVWDAFLRGQLIISLIVILAYDVLLTILGTRLTLAIALMAGLARFIPWIGPMITWSATAIVASVQGSNYLGLSGVQYTLVVLGACLLLDQVMDNLIIPRLLGHTLGVHPAGVLITALIAARIIGLVGLVIAAPMLASLNLIGRYVMHKMLDLNPWPEAEVLPAAKPPFWRGSIASLANWIGKIQKYIRTHKKKRG